MAMNPMQRKANNYLIIGVLVTLLITGTVIAVLCMQLIKIQKERQAEKDALKMVYVVASPIKSGDAISAASLVKVAAPTTVISNSAIGISEISEETIAKIDINAGTIITSEMITTVEDKTTNDLRKQEYNMIEIPTQIQTGDYIDVRLRLPNGADYVVVSKKKVEIPIINGVDSENTIWIRMTEAETLVMSNAIVEAYIMKGGLLYATTYVEPGLQDVVTPTYVPSGVVQKLIYSDPNIEKEAKAALISRYNDNTSTRTDTISGVLNLYVDDAQDNIKNGIQEEINKRTQERKSYLESLGGGY